MEIVEVTEYSQNLKEAMNSFIPQLSSSAVPLDEEFLSTIISTRCTQLFVAVEDGEYFGCLTLVTFPIPTGIRAWIEDVVVDEKARGKGVGRLLSEHAIDIARENGAKTVDLTSRPSRVAANNLYKDIGFIERSTNIYRFESGT